MLYELEVSTTEQIIETEEEANFEGDKRHKKKWFVLVVEITCYFLICLLVHFLKSNLLQNCPLFCFLAQSVSF